ncbi:hypothetical protein BDV11DRAFT_197291 [Aspergillus similis]
MPSTAHSLTPRRGGSRAFESTGHFSRTISSSRTCSLQISGRNLCCICDPEFLEPRLRDDDGKLHLRWPAGPRPRRRPWLLGRSIQIAIRANPASYTDLWWAQQGASHNFGIVAIFK